MPSGTSEVDHRPDTRLAVALGAVLLAAVAGPALWAWSVRDRLPDEVVAHWGAGGVPTRTEPLGRNLLLLGAVSLLVAGAIALVAVLGRHPVAMRRMLAGTAAWTATLLAAAQLDALVRHLDVTDPTTVGAPTTGLLVGTVGGLVVAVAVAAAAREAPHRTLADAPPSPDAPRLPGGRGARTEVAVFERTAHTSRAVLALVAVATLPLVALAFVAGWWTAVLAVVVAAIVLASTRFTTTVDRRGLTVRSVGWTLVHVPLAEVAEASVADIDAMWEFGGWGLRVDVHGRTGIISGSGEALTVRRADRTEVVVTVEDAATAAATLNTLADAAHDGR